MMTDKQFECLLEVAKNNFNGRELCGILISQNFDIENKVAKSILFNLATWNIKTEDQILFMLIATSQLQQNLIVKSKLDKKFIETYCGLRDTEKSIISLLSNYKIE